MDIYTYVATCNPYQAKSILHKYGYSAQGVKNEMDLGACLKQLVAYEGEDALNDVLESHPDKNILQEFSDKNNPKEKKKCDCRYCKGDCQCKYDNRYSNFAGNPDPSAKSTREVSIFIIASALLLASAILVKK
jgi:hypothetical protein